MPKFSLKPQSYRLRTILLAPLLPALAVTLTLTFLGYQMDNRNYELVAHRRGQELIAAGLDRLQDGHILEPYYTPVLAVQEEVARAVAQQDDAGLAQVLMPLKARLGLDQVLVYDRAGKELLALGSRRLDLPAATLVMPSLGGTTHTHFLATDDGLSALAAMPISGPQRVEGVMVVARYQNLQDLVGLGSADLFVFHEGRMTGSSEADPAVLAAVRQSQPDEPGITALNRTLERTGYHAVVQPVDGGQLVAVVPVRDLTGPYRWRMAFMLAGTAGLTVILLLLGLAESRRLARPLEEMAAVAGEMVRGNYHKRAAPVHIRELDELAGAVNQMADQVEAQVAALAHQAFYDALTGLPNRTLFVERLDRALARADRRQRSVAVLFLDLDNFKVLNDSLGHSTGDRMLAVVAERLKAALSEEDTAARIGGDEFTILLEEVTGEQDATRVAERILAQLREPLVIDGHEWFTSTSIGIALSTPYQDTADSLMQNADAAMYRVKITLGKGNCEVFDPSMNARVRDRLALETDLRHALERHELRVHYQPLIHLPTGRTIGAEALVRWQHPARGLVPPSQFIPLAEETGLILPIGAWVLEQACQEAVGWHQAFPDRPFLISVNLSARQLQHDGLVEEIAAIMAKTGINPKALKLEITESVMMHDAEAAVGRLRQLKGLGIHLAMDDFGTGYSSLAYLKRFPLDTLKIDRSFVDQVGVESEATAIVNAVIGLSRALGMSVTAEGIETPAQLAVLRELGCDCGQGYLFAKPLTPEEIRHFFRQEQGAAVYRIS